MRPLLLGVFCDVAARAVFAASRAIPRQDPLSYALLHSPAISPDPCSTRGSCRRRWASRYVFRCAMGWNRGGNVRLTFVRNRCFVDRGPSTSPGAPGALCDLEGQHARRGRYATTLRAPQGRSWLTPSTVRRCCRAQASCCSLGLKREGIGAPRPTKAWSRRACSKIREDGSERFAREGPARASDRPRCSRDINHEVSV